MDELVIKMTGEHGEEGIFAQTYRRGSIVRAAFAEKGGLKPKVYKSEQRAILGVKALESKLTDRYEYEIIPREAVTDRLGLGGLTNFDYLHPDDFRIEKSLPQNNKWKCALHADVETWTSCEYFNTEREAIAAARKAIRTYNRYRDLNILEDLLGHSADGKKIKSFAIGQCKVPVLSIDVDGLLESVQQSIYDEVGEAAEDYLDDVEKEEKKELEDLIIDWFHRHGYAPTFYNVENIETVQVYRTINENQNDIGDPKEGL